MDDQETVRLKMQSQSHSQLISIIENLKDWPQAIVKAAASEITNRGGMEAVKVKAKSGEDGATITVNEREQIIAAKQKNSYIKLGVAVVVILALTLPFHWVITPDFTVFPKDNLTFSNTFIFPGDINRMVERYNDKSLLDKMLDKDDPLMKKLVEKGIIKRN